MVIKSYVAPSVAGALKLIRAELGPKAVVLKTRGLSVRESGVGRRMVEITACLERPSVGALSASLSDRREERESPAQMNNLTDGRESALTALGSPSAPEPSANNIEKQFEGLAVGTDVSGESITEEHDNMTGNNSGSARSGMVDIRDVESFAKRLEEKLDMILDTHLNVESISDIPAELTPVARLLIAQDIPERFWRPIFKTITQKISSGSSERIMEYAEEALVAELAGRCHPGVPLQSGDVALFIGPAGCGKTSVLGKIAVDLLFNKKVKTELSTLDDFRVAAQEEIVSYGEALGATFLSPEEIATTSKAGAAKPERALLVDCHSNINDQRQFMRLKQRASALRPTVVFLVVSALMRSADVSRLVRRFEILNPTHIIATHTDLTDTIGGLYTAAIDSGVKICALTNSPGSIGELLIPDPAAMARNIVGRSK